MSMWSVYSFTQHYGSHHPFNRYFSCWRNNIAQGKLAETLYKLREI